MVLCDQDDIWLPEKLQEKESAFKENSNISVLNTSFKYIDENDKFIKAENKKGTSNNNLILHEIQENATENIPLDLVINKNISPGMTMAGRKDIIKEYLKYSNNRSLHDFELNCVGALFDGLYFYNKVLSYYRIHQNQAVSIGNIKKKKKS